MLIIFIPYVILAKHNGSSPNNTISEIEKISTTVVQLKHSSGAVSYHSLSNGKKLSHYEPTPIELRDSPRLTLVQQENGKSVILKQHQRQVDTIHLPHLPRIEKPIVKESSTKYYYAIYSLQQQRADTIYVFNVQKKNVSHFITTPSQISELRNPSFHTNDTFITNVSGCLCEGQDSRVLHLYSIANNYQYQIPYKKHTSEVNQDIHIESSRVWSINDTSLYIWAYDSLKSPLKFDFKQFFNTSKYQYDISMIGKNIFDYHITKANTVRFVTGLNSTLIVREIDQHGNSIANKQKSIKDLHSVFLDSNGLAVGITKQGIFKAF